jgi:hypothetical protein
VNNSSSNLTEAEAIARNKIREGDLLHHVSKGYGIRFTKDIGPGHLTTTVDLAQKGNSHDRENDPVDMEG